MARRRRVEPVTREHAEEMGRDRRLTLPRPAPSPPTG
jgi:hypothetical protein